VAATLAWITPAPRLDRHNTVRRENRSAIAPPASRKISCGMTWLAITMPRSVGCPEAFRTDSASVTGVIALPSMEIARPRKKPPNGGRSTSGKKDTVEEFDRPCRHRLTLR
jgi:hypothetical protein